MYEPKTLRNARNVVIIVKKSERKEVSLWARAASPGQKKKH
jgi:hypothetical protein